MAQGTVIWFNPTKGYGWISPDDGGPDVFFHISAVERAGLGELREGQRVEYNLEQDQRMGKMSAGNLKVIGETTNENEEMLNERTCPECERERPPFGPCPGCGDFKLFEDDEVCDHCGTRLDFGGGCPQCDETCPTCHGPLSRGRCVSDSCVAGKPDIQEPDIQDSSMTDMHLESESMDRRIQESMRKIQQRVYRTVAEATQDQKTNNTLKEQNMTTRTIMNESQDLVEICNTCKGSVIYNEYLGGWKHWNERSAALARCKFHNKVLTVDDIKQVPRSELLEEKLVRKMQSNGIKLSEARAVANLMINEGMPARHAFKTVRSNNNY
jgi:CspA family cold shock protein